MQQYNVTGMSSMKKRLIASLILLVVLMYF